ncbi:MAG: response regulator [Lachnospiraceae bacterium]|jgi:CheY-like chemotaxis protein|nr:response regulator [Lachnospiraceae bacterium]
MVHLELLQKISVLNIKAADMTLEELEAFALKINSFIDNYTIIAGRLKQSMSDRDMATIPGCLGHVAEILKSINADVLVNECQGYVRSAATKDVDVLVAELTAFTSKLSALSIDLQMCLYADMSATAAPDLAAEEEGGGSAGTKLVLAVDDAPFFLQALKAHLSDTPCKLVCVSSGTEALRFIERNSPNLFILDIEMPEMDGYELAMQIRAREKTAPIVFLTGNSDKESVIQALSVGASDFIVKPSSKEEVLSRIARFL